MQSKLVTRSKSWNKSLSIIAILDFFAYADMALLTVFRKSVMLTLTALFFGIFLIGTSCKAEQSLQGMELQEKEGQKD